MRGWAALAWALGLSPRRAQAGGARGRARVMGADETAIRVNGEKTVVGVVTDAETGQVPGLEVLVARDSDGFMEWLCGSRAVTGPRRWSRTTLAAYKPGASVWESSVRFA